MSEQILKLKEELHNELDLITELLGYAEPPFQYKDKLTELKFLCNYKENSGWISPNGKMPYIHLKPGLIMTIRFMSGLEHHNVGRFYRDYRWSNMGNIYDIVAYKITR